MAANDAMKAFASVVEHLSGEVNRELAALRRQATLSPWLPSSWALAWLAALAVTIGHLLYQAQAPEIVRKAARDEHVKRRREAFREQQHDDDFEESWRRVATAWTGKLGSVKNWKFSDGLIKALVNMREESDSEVHDFELFGQALSAELGSFALTHIYHLAERPLRISEVPQEVPKEDYVKRRTEDFLKHYRDEIQSWRRDLMRALPYERFRARKDAEEAVRTAPVLNRLAAHHELLTQSAQRLLQEVFGPGVAAVTPDEELRLKLDVVGDAARLDYNAALLQQPLAIVVALSFYALAGAIVLWLLGQQSASVFRAAGWL